MGTPIATFYRAKSAEFSAENALFDMNLMATQLGTTKTVGGKKMVDGKEVSVKITVPAMESFTVAEDGKYTLKHAPKAAPSEIYAINGDSTFGTKYTKATAVSETEFTFAEQVITVQVEEKDAEGKVVTPGIPVGTEMFVMYEYESEEAVEVVNSAKNFPVGCKFVMEVLGCDVCDQTNLIYAYVIFNNAKLSPDFDWSIATDGSHPFSMRAQQDYCDKEKRLFSIIIPGDQE